MFPHLLLLFICVPLLESFLLLRAGALLGWSETFGIILLTGMLGAWLAKWQGLRAVREIKSRLNRGQLPADQILDGALILAGGLLLMTPGFITDAAGFSLLVPSARRFWRFLLRRYIKSHFIMSTSWHGRGPKSDGPPSWNDGSTIDVPSEPLSGDDVPGGGP